VQPDRAPDRNFYVGESIGRQVSDKIPQGLSDGDCRAREMHPPTQGRNTPAKWKAQNRGSFLSQVAEVDLF